MDQAVTSNLNSIDLFADRSYRAAANAEIALSGITAKVLSEDGTHPGATKDRLRDWKSCVYPSASGERTGIPIRNRSRLGNEHGWAILG